MTGPRPHPPPPLLADAMLGGLARWLRVLGLDEPLEEADPARARRHVPPWVARTHDRFRRCPDCGRLYWRGSHGRRMEARLRRMGIDLS